MAKKVCEVCEETFEAWSPKARFCSRECWANRERKVNLVACVCVQCGETYYVGSYRVGKTRFCSQRCNALTPNFKRDRAKVRALKGNVPASKLSPELRKAKDAFFNQRCGARDRGIGWEFTFEAWYKFWKKSGHWYERGRCKGQYVMARFGDKGPYAIGNVRITKTESNLDEREAPAGERNPHSRLTESDILEIRGLEGKMSRPQIAKKFNINHWHVRDIQKRRCWVHI